jgi:hypothetical protein
MNKFQSNHITFGPGVKKITQEEFDNIQSNFKNLIKQNEQEQQKQQIKKLQTQIAATDYQIIKCYEYSLAGLELPYDIQELHNSREAIREQIRELEEQI